MASLSCWLSPVGLLPLRSGLSAVANSTEKLAGLQPRPVMAQGVRVQTNAREYFGISVYLAVSETTISKD